MFICKKYIELVLTLSSIDNNIRNKKIVIISTTLIYNNNISSEFLNNWQLHVGGKTIHKFYHHNFIKEIIH